MTTLSPVDLLVLHAVRIKGFADAPAVAQRFDLDPAEVTEHLQDAEAHGWITHSAFAGSAGWSLTERGRVEGERRLALELAATGRAGEIRSVFHEDFLPLNARVLSACTDWQLRKAPDGRLLPNDHVDRAWDARVLRELAEVGRELGGLVQRLSGILARFGGYDRRYGAALERARAGEGDWVDRMDVDSCHRVWFELHEDLLATLGVERGG